MVRYGRCVTERYRCVTVTRYFCVTHGPPVPVRLHPHAGLGFDPVPSLHQAAGIGVPVVDLLAGIKKASGRQRLPEHAWWAFPATGRGQLLVVKGGQITVAGVV